MVIDVIDPDTKAKIDTMTHIEMARLWRFAPSNEPLLTGVNGVYFAKLFRRKGGFTPAISKELGHSPIRKFFNKLWKKFLEEPKKLDDSDWWVVVENNDE